MTKQKIRCAMITEMLVADSIGVEYLLAVLRKEQYPVKLLLDSGGFKPWKTESESKFNANYFSDFCKDIDVLFVSCATDYCQRALLLTDYIKGVYPDLIICFGGPHATYSHEFLVNQPNIDYVCRGEGEISIIHLLKYIEKKVDFLPSGVYHINDEGHMEGAGYGPLPDLDGLPFPDKTDYNVQQPFVKKIYSINLGRGCYNKCTFCNSPVILKSYREEDQVQIRRRSVDNVIEELIIAKRDYSPKLVVFNDDTFIYGKKYMREFAEKYKEHIGIPFSCTTQPNFFDEEIIQMLAEAGMANVEVGIQSMNEDIRLGVFGRTETNDNIKNFIKMCGKFGVYTHTDHILNPWETEEILKKQIESYIDAAPAWINVFYLRYYPALPIIQTAIKDGYLREEAQGDIQKGVIYKNFFFGGDLDESIIKRHKRYILFINFIGILPKWFAMFLFKTKLYYVFQYIPKSVIFPLRGINALIRPNDSWGRLNLEQFVTDFFSFFKFGKSSSGQNQL